VAGHICLDLIPSFGTGARDLGQILVPGKLVNVGRAETTTGGVLGNTGLALHRLGIGTRLMGKVGEDLFGRAVLGLLKAEGGDLASGLKAVPGEATSYTVVISPPGVDRVFLHCPGTNDTLGPEDFDFAGPETRDSGRLRYFHFGYPPIMRRFYEDGGLNMKALLARAKAKGLTTSLDMVKPDPASEAGRLDWKAWLEAVLPAVDIFMPSLEEILLMLDRKRYAWAEQGLDPGRVDGRLLAEVSDRLISRGCAAVALKLGEQGLYFRTTEQGPRLAEAGLSHPAKTQPWQGRELYTPCFQVQVRGTRAAGDSTNAGILAGLVAGLDPRYIVRMAVAVGACSVETREGPGALPAWAGVEKRVEKGWKQRPLELQLAQFRKNEQLGLWHGPRDRSS
jgi:sugar/nucleoside kinase (ribokinase family)